MYLTYNRRTRQLTSFSIVLGYKQNIDVEGLVYYNDYIVIENRPDVDFIETNFDEIMQVTTIVPGQYELEEFKENLLDLYEKKQEFLEEGKLLLKNKIGEITENVDIGYYFEMKRIGKKLKQNRSNVSNNEQLLFKVHSNVLETGLSEREVAEEMIGDTNEKLKKLNSVYAHYRKFRRKVDQATSMEDLRQQMRIFENVITKWLPSLI